MSIRYRAADGTETICAGLTPGGDIEAGAVDTRKGNFTVPRTSPDTTSFVSVTFSEAMSDSDYEVNLYSPADSDSGIRTFELTVYNRTTTGFKVAATRTVSTANDPVNFSYTAWKIYSVQHAAQNAEDIANIKATIPSTASSTNKLATSNDVSNLNTSLGSRLDDVEDVIDATASITNKLVSQSTMQTAIDNVEIDVDASIDATSENPVQNKVIKTALDNKENKQFTGTQAEWNALTEVQKKSYRIANITDDTDYVGNIVDTVADGNMSAVTSNAVFDTINNKTVTQITTSLSENFQIINYQHYAQSYIITKGNMCQIDIVIECLNDCSGSQSICAVPIPETLFTLCTQPWDMAYQFGFNDQRRESLIQGGILYINGGKAGTRYVLHLNYII